MSSFRNRCTWSILIVAVLYVCFGIQLAAGKCAGQWAIHACAGANGKRSDSQLPPEYRQEPRRVSLEDLLLSAATRDKIETQPEYRLYRPEIDREEKIKYLWKKLLLAIGERDDA